MGVSEKHIYEAMLTGPQQMPVFSDQVLQPDDKRDVIAYLKALENQKDPGGFGLGQARPGLRRSVGLVGRYRPAGRRGGLDRRQGRQGQGSEGRVTDEKPNLPAVSAEQEHGPVQVAEPIPDPGIEPHEPRITDVDPKAADRVERQVSTMFTLAGLFAVGSCVAYFAIPRDSVLEFGPLTGNANNLTIGLCLGLALFLIGAGAIQWAKKLMVDTEISEDRHPAYTELGPRRPRSSTRSRRVSPSPVSPAAS